MAFWDKWFKPSKEEQTKISLRAEIQKLINLCSSLTDDLDIKLNQIKDKTTQVSIKKVKNQVNGAKDHLEGADKSLSELNVQLTIEELKEADENVNSKNLSDNALNYLISSIKILPKQYLTDVNYLRTNLDKLIRRDLPSFKTAS